MVAHGEKSDRNVVQGGSGFADRMVFSNKVRFPRSGPEKEAVPDFVGVAKITAPGAVDPPARPLTCKWPCLSSPPCIGRGVRLVPRLQGSLGKRGWSEERDWSGHRGDPAAGAEIYEVE